MRNAHLVLATMLVAGFPSLATAQHWSYEGEAAPANWGKLDPKFATCATGKNQSPIDIGSTKPGSGKPPGLSYAKGTTEMVNNGHTVQVNYAPGSSLSVDGRTFELKQFHFHAPSENTVNGKHFPMEGHLVHADAQGNLAVVAVMFSEGAANPALESLWKAMPSKAGAKSALKDPVSAADLLPKERKYYRFEGSLTTPPCSEGVRWMVLQKPVTASKAQIEAFRKAVGFANNRPVQALNARPVSTE